jgi:hypothetical protein
VEQAATVGLAAELLLHRLQEPGGQTLKDGFGVGLCSHRGRNCRFQVYNCGG